MLEVSSKKGLTAFQGSATELPFQDNSFDTACSFKVLAHVPDIKKAVKEIARVVKPGGHLVLEFYNPNSIRGMIKHLKPKTKIGDKISDEDVYTRYDSMKDIKTYIPEDLEIIEVRGTRIVVTAAFIMRLPLISSLFKAADRLLGLSPFKYLAGFLIVIAKKSS
jgi:SAM-dependent methyltransferase